MLARFRFPRLYAAASLKPVQVRLLGHRVAGFSAALCRGLIEAGRAWRARASPSRRFPRLYAAASLKRSAQAAKAAVDVGGFPRLYAAASLKLVSAIACRRSPAVGFPRLYAAASLKPVQVRLLGHRVAGFSAALCRGLIEASPTAGRRCSRASVFRGFMPRPH